MGPKGHITWKTVQNRKRELISWFDNRISAVRLTVGSIYSDCLMRLVTLISIVNCRVSLITGVNLQVYYTLLTWPHPG